MSANDNSAMIPIDADVRRQALDPGQSFAISAPAGSGKTGLLTQRILTLLAHAEQPENILAMTFTRKAADEMHHRIMEALQGTSEGNNNHELNPHQQLTRQLAEAVLKRDKELNWQLLVAPHRLRIQTIDSFCQHLVDQLPLNSGINGALEATENPQNLYQQTVREFFSLLNQPQHQADMGVLLGHLDNNLYKLEGLLVDLLGKRNQWLSVLYKTANSEFANEILLESLQRTIESSLLDLADELSPYLDELIPLLNYAANHIEQKDPSSPLVILKEFNSQVTTNADDLPYWQQLANFLLKKNDNPDQCDWRKTVNVNNGFPPSNDKNSIEHLNKQSMIALLGDLSDNKTLLLALRDTKALPSLESLSQDAVIESLTRLLPHLVALFQLCCREQGQCDFNEIAQAAVLALGEEQQPTNLALKLDYQIKHILVDEFQDTSLIQLNLLEKLTAGWQVDDGRTVFVVGDAMQSCYGFRDAKVGLFLRVRQHGIGQIPLEPLDLVVNFRSDALIVDWVNRVFSEVLPPEDSPRRGAVAYRMAQAKTDVNGDGSIQLLGFHDSDQQAKNIVDIVQKHLRDSDSDTIAILARTRGHLQNILYTLRDANIDWEAQDVDALRAQMAIIDLVSLTKACSDFSDRISWLSILRAPWCGLDMHDLHTVANAGEKGSLIWHQIINADKLALSETGKMCLLRLRTILSPAFENSHRKPFRQWLQGLWMALGGPASVMNPIETDSSVNYFDLLEKHCGAWGIEQWEVFENALDRLYAKSPQASRLQVMTLHKSKGLEFDVVILPHLEKRPKADSKDLLLWEDSVDEQGNINFLISPIATIAEKKQQDNQLYDFLWREQNIARDLESARLLYVACTRAIKQLYLCACVKFDEKSGELKPPASKSLLAKMWSIIGSEFVIAQTPDQNNAEFEQESDEDDNQGKKILSKILRLDPHRPAIDFPSDQTLAPYRRPAYFHQDELANADALLNRHQRYTGTLIHRALETACLLGWQNYRVTEQIEVWASQLGQLGVAPSARPALIDTISAAITRTLADPKGQWLLDNQHLNSVCEWHLSARHQDPQFTSTQEWVIDRSFVDAGVRWMIDYKSSVPAPGQAESDFLLQEAEQYREQLSSYQRVVHALDSQFPIKTALYFPMLAQFYPLSD